MQKKIKIFLFFICLQISSYVLSNEIENQIEPEPFSMIQKSERNNLRFKNFIVISANDYATKVGYEILKKGGNAADAAVGIQLTLGLVEPQSSGLGGGIFLTYYDSNTKKILSYEGREKAPQALNEKIFLDSNNKPKKFFDAVLGGKSVGVPALLKTMFLFHQKYGTLKWKEIIKPVISIADEGFIPPNRLKNALKKEKYLFQLYPNSIFKNIKKNPNSIFKNKDYAETLRIISKNYNSFYEGEIAKNIVKTVGSSINPGNLELPDLKNYNPEIRQSFCARLNSGYKICGPNLPSSGTICVIQALTLIEELYKKNLSTKKNLEEILEILDFIYFLRDKDLADDKFINVNLDELLDLNILKKKFNFFKEKKNKASEIYNLNEIFNSTTHYSIVDRNRNVISATSSIESSFGSRLFVNGFFLNNQLTDFSFSITDKFGKKNKNRPQPGKRPLSSMSPLIIFDKNDDFFMTIGSPGGKAIISYVVRVLNEILYLDSGVAKSISNPNYISINNRVFLENQNQAKLISKNVKIRKLTSGLGVIKKDEDLYLGVVDHRRDGTVRGD